jgi:hypothetical protein
MSRQNRAEFCSRIGLSAVVSATSCSAFSCSQILAIAPTAQRGAALRPRHTYSTTHDVPGRHASRARGRGYTSRAGARRCVCLSCCGRSTRVK